MEYSNPERASGHWWVTVAKLPYRELELVPTGLNQYSDNMLAVNEIRYIEAYKFQAKLSNGVEGIFDVSPYINKGIFTQLKSFSYLKQVRINFAGICWPNGQDFSADTIEYEVTKRLNNEITSN